MIFMAQAKIHYIGLLLSKVFKAFYNAAHLPVPPWLLPTPQASQATPFHLPAFAHAVLPAQHTSPYHSPPAKFLYCSLKAGLGGPCSVKPVSLPHGELITPTVFPLPRGRPP